MEFYKGFGVQPQWLPFLASLEHLHLKALDDMRDFETMMAILHDGQRGCFLIWHILVTSKESIHWNINNYAPFRHEYGHFIKMCDDTCTVDTGNVYSRLTHFPLT